MASTLLDISNLNILLSNSFRSKAIVSGVNLSINSGETFVLLGESGSGKSLTAYSIVQLLAPELVISPKSRILFHDQDLLAYSEKEMQAIRGKKIGFIFQEPNTALDPILSIGNQMKAILIKKRTIGDLNFEVESLLDKVKIPDPKIVAQSYPHQLSGGMKQRIIIAMAIALEPELIIADEPTTALDVSVTIEILSLIQELQHSMQLTLLMITHDWHVASMIADRVAVMYQGGIVEKSSDKKIFQKPSHPYTQYLKAAKPSWGKRNFYLPVPKDDDSILPYVQNTGCQFAPRCQYKISSCTDTKPSWKKISQSQVRCHLYKNNAVDFFVEKQINACQSTKTQKPSVILKLKNISAGYPSYQGWRQRCGHIKNIIQDINLEVHAQSTFALIGESGSGKTTLLRTLLNLTNISKGEIEYLHGAPKKNANIQILFQDPYSSMDPKLTVDKIIKEGIESSKTNKNILEVGNLLEQVGLSSQDLYKYPHEFSGGQRQRIALARALASQPQMLLLDEPTSALDISAQAKILNLLKQSQKNQGMSYFLVTHDMEVVEYMADVVAVMYRGRIVEQGSISEIIEKAKHPYTKMLLACVKLEKLTDFLISKNDSQEIKSSSCPYQNSCALASEICSYKLPHKKNYSSSHWVMCHHADE